MTMPEQLPQVAILCIRYPDPRKTVFDHQSQQQLRILAIGLLFAYPFRTNFCCIPDPQFQLQLVQQTFEPASVPAGFHSHTGLQTLLFQLAVKLLGFLGMNQALFPRFTGLNIRERNLLEARMVVTPYNQHVRLLSSEPFSWFAPPKSTRAWEPTLFMESLHSL